VGDPGPPPKTRTRKASKRPNQSELVKIALEGGADVALIEKIIDFQQDLNRTEAVQAFNTAMVSFKKSAPEIIKNAPVDYTTSEGSKIAYDYATLDNVCRAIDDSLAEVGVSYRWKTGRTNENDVVVTCVLFHEGGHSVDTSLFAAPDGSGHKNPVQAISSTVSYLERYTLLAVTGVAVAGLDSDSNSLKVNTISGQQASNIIQLISDVGLTRKKFFKFCEGWLNVSKIEDIPESEFDAVLSALESKKIKA